MEPQHLWFEFGLGLFMPDLPPTLSPHVPRHSQLSNCPIKAKYPQKKQHFYTCMAQKCLGTIVSLSFMQVSAINVLLKGLKGLNISPNALALSKPLLPITC